MGILSGKYFSPNGDPADARLNLFKGKYSEGESRYNLSNTILKVATKIASLAIRSGNGLLLKGGKEAKRSNAILHKGKSHNPSTEKMSNADTIDLEDYHRIDPAPNSRATINCGPNEHGTSLV